MSQVRNYFMTHLIDPQEMALAPAATAVSNVDPEDVEETRRVISGHIDKMSKLQRHPDVLDILEKAELMSDTIMKSLQQCRSAAVMHQLKTGVEHVGSQIHVIEQRLKALHMNSTSGRMQAMTISVSDAPAPPTPTNSEPAPPWPYLVGCQHVMRDAPRIGHLCSKPKILGSIFCSAHVIRTDKGEFDNTRPKALCRMNKDIGHMVHVVTGFVMDKVNIRAVCGRYYKDPEVGKKQGRKETSDGFFELLPSDKDEVSYWEFEWPSQTHGVSPSKRKLNDDDMATDETPKKARKDVVNVYIDGGIPNVPEAELRDGTAIAAVFFGENDDRNLAERVPGAATKNRAKLYAVVRAMDILAGVSHVVVHLDSQYVVNGMTTLMAGWKAKNFKDVQNADMFVLLDSYCQNRKVEWRTTSSPPAEAEQLLKTALSRSTPLQSPSGGSVPRANPSLISAIRAVNSRNGKKKGKFASDADEESVQHHKETSKAATKLWKTVDEFDSDAEVEM